MRLEICFNDFSPRSVSRADRHWTHAGLRCYVSDSPRKIVSLILQAIVIHILWNISAVTWFRGSFFTLYSTGFHLSVEVMNIFNHKSQRKLRGFVCVLVLWKWFKTSILALKHSTILKPFHLNLFFVCAHLKERSSFQNYSMFTFQRNSIGLALFVLSWLIDAVFTTLKPPLALR